MDDVRVNKITVNVDIKDDYTTISLYRTNKLLGSLQEDELGIESFGKSGVSLKAYQMYCRDIVINLLDNGGIKGYYYEPKSESESVKYGMGQFRSACSDYISDILGDGYEFTMTQNDIEHEIEQYSDKYIKDARVDFEVLLRQYNIRFKVCAEIKSGQMCRPKTFIYNNNEYNLNITNINKVVKQSS
jgi:hypothetical protein